MREREEEKNFHRRREKVMKEKEEKTLVR